MDFTIITQMSVDVYFISLIIVFIMMNIVFQTTLKKIIRHDDIMMVELLVLVVSLFNPIIGMIFMFVLLVLKKIDRWRQTRQRKGLIVRFIINITNSLTKLIKYIEGK